MYVYMFVCLYVCIYVCFSVYVFYNAYVYMGRDSSNKCTTAMHDTMKLQQLRVSSTSGL